MRRWTRSRRKARGLIWFSSTRRIKWRIRAKCARHSMTRGAGGSVLLVVEHRKGRVPMLDARFEAFDLRHYGDTEITFVRRAQQEEEGGA